MKLFEEGAALAGFCNKKLSEAEQKIYKISAGESGADENEL